MASTLELYDGTTTLDLLGSVYTTRRITRLGDTVQTRGQTDPRLRQPIAIDLNITGTSADNLVAQIRALDSMLVQATHRQELGHGTIVVLKTQLGSTDADDIQYRVIRGGLVHPDTLLQVVLLSQWKVIEATIRLEVEPLGRLASIAPFARVIENEQDSPGRNYVDISDLHSPSLTFDGVDDDVTVSDDAAIQDIFDGGGTVEFWFRVASDGENDAGRVVFKRSSGVGGWDIFVSSEASGKVKLEFVMEFSGTQGRWATTATEITLDEWTQGAITYDSDATGNNPTFYITPEGGTTRTLTVGDGLTETSTPVGTRDSDATFDLLIGNDSISAGTFDGRITRMRMWSDIRTAQELSDNKDLGLEGDEAGLVGYWDFAEGSGATVKDRTANGNDGTISGATWTIDDVEGSAAGRLNLKIHDANNGGGNAWTGSKTMWVAKRTGSRRTDDLFLESTDSVTEGAVAAFVETGGGAVSSGTTGGLTTNASGGTSAHLKFTANQASNMITTWSITGRFNIDIAAANIPAGIFRVLARVGWQETGTTSGFAASQFGFGLGYDYGGQTVTPVDGKDTKMSLAEDTWETLDIGQIIIPPVATPDGYTRPSLQLRINCIFDEDGGAAALGASGDTVSWFLDCVYLLPIDEGAVTVGSIGTADRILVDGQSDKPGVYKLNASDVVQDFADSVGPPPPVGPEPTRIYVVRDDTGDPTTTQFTVTPVYIPRVVGV